MGRPAQSLITRDMAARAALELIDRDGLDAFSLPRLARALGVNPSSLYHHFDDRREVLALVAQSIVHNTRRARRRVGPDLWQDWLVRQSLHLRSAILRHRNAAPLLVQFAPRHTMMPLFEDAAAYLTQCGVAADLQVTILDAIETLSIGAAITEAMMRPHGGRAVFPLVNGYAHPHLSAAVSANPQTMRELYEAKLRTYLRGLRPALDGPSPTGGSAG